SCRSQTTDCTPTTGPCNAKGEAGCAALDFVIFCGDSPAASPIETVPAGNAATTSNSAKTDSQEDQSTVSGTDLYDTPDDPSAAVAEAQAIMITRLGALASLDAGNITQNMVTFAKAQQSCDELIKSGNSNCAVNDPSFLRSGPAAPIAAEAEKATGLSREELAALMDRTSREKTSTGPTLLSRALLPLTIIAEEAKNKTFRKEAEKVLKYVGDEKKKRAQTPQDENSSSLKPEVGPMDAKPELVAKDVSGVSLPSRPIEINSKDMEEIQKMLLELSKFSDSSADGNSAENEQKSEAKNTDMSLFVRVQKNYRKRTSLFFGSPIIKKPAPGKKSAEPLQKPAPAKKSPATLKRAAQAPSEEGYRTVCPKKSKKCFIVP
ncbi:MAG: hypothetical protein ACXWQO_06445, partial [Bdellovibrionota bacterium]